MRVAALNEAEASDRQNGRDLSRANAIDLFRTKAVMCGITRWGLANVGLRPVERWW